MSIHKTQPYTKFYTCTHRSHKCCIALYMEGKQPIYSDCKIMPQEDFREYSVEQKLCVELFCLYIYILFLMFIILVYF